jgi:hypothetical protein
MHEAIATTPATLSSVELTRNAKGGTQINVKIYSEDPIQAEAQAMHIYDELRAVYPAGD